MHHLVSNGDGWRISLHQSYDPAKRVHGRNPVVIVPGYGMNSFIFGFHPNGLSLEGYLVDAGFEVWRIDLRGQGESVRDGGRDEYGLVDLARTDLRVALRTVQERTVTGRERIDVIGASLGGSLMFAHAVLEPDAPFGTLVAMGSPVRWVKSHVLVRALFAWPALVGRVQLRGTRAAAGFALPLLARHAPWVLSIYMNPDVTDTRAAREMIRTVEDPSRHLNREIAHWLRDRDLVIAGRNIARELGRVRNPLLCIYANGDGIVPPETATYAYHHVGSSTRALLEVGARDLAHAHADMFIGNGAHEHVFRPLARWLADPSAVVAEGPGGRVGS